MALIKVIINNNYIILKNNEITPQMRFDNSF